MVVQSGFEAGFLKAEYQIVQLITDRKTTGANALRLMAKKISRRALAPVQKY
tara:strand:+ start:143617 stop:143772 length:156 start_codon:yes stop_codon:yes gene_type:complete